ncbi:MAG TPA: pyridoxal phosphate-dependent aminotransferase [Clostridiaceae bacterium]|nr:pyridoxal phosphate-dependent aminotransferase [Clostridiaceae bacterium]
MFSREITEQLGSSSFIRKMFEEGNRLREIYGAENVFDYSIGNPEIEPPEAVKEALKRLVLDDTPGAHRYMSNAGFTDVRSKIAEKLKEESDVDISGEHVVMTCGAAAAINVVLKSILNPQEEVIVFSPYFVEYLFYIKNYQGKPVIVKANEETFEPDLERLEAAITPLTKAIIINTPNNPTGVVYKKEVLQKMAEVLKQKEQEYGTTILVISDQPYDKIIFDGVELPSILKIFQNSIIVNSYSKSLALPGERIGYIAANPLIENIETLMGCFTMCNRILGFVNAPALFQKVVLEAIDATVDIEEYKKRRDILYNHLIKLGFRCVKPQGTFYLFPESLISDDIEFAQAAQKYNLLFVPGSGFGCPGHFRISYCIDMKIIENSLPAFEKLAAEFK